MDRGYPTGNTHRFTLPSLPLALGERAVVGRFAPESFHFGGNGKSLWLFFCGWENKGEAPGGASFLLQGLDSAGGYFAVAFRNGNGFVGVPIWAASPENGLPSTMSTDPWVRDIFRVSAFSEKSISARGIQKR